MSANVISAEVLSPGTVEGALRLAVQHEHSTVSDTTADHHDAAEEVQRFRHHAALLGQDLARVAERLELESYSDEAGIFRAHRRMLEDAQFERQVCELIQQRGITAAAAVDQVLSRMSAKLRTVADSVMAGRASDLDDLASQLCVKLKQQTRALPAQLLTDEQVPVLALPELTPSYLLEARDAGVRGFVVEHGTGLAHAVILARSFRLPVLRVTDLEQLRGKEGREVRLDGDRAELVIDPAHAATARADPPAVPASPTPPAEAATLPARLWLSIVDPAQLEGVEWTDISGIGLYRTETVFMQQRDFPTEQEQMAMYQRVFQQAGDRPVTVRTLDIGGDKMLAYLRLGPQTNPYLGLRAHRLFEYHPELMVTQLRAILRAAHGGRLRLLHPMIEHTQAWREVQHLVQHAVDSLRRQGVAFQERFEQGAMVETPSAAWDFPRLLRHMDFASVGTNDLTSYFFAVERSSANVAHLYQPEHPVMLQVLRHLAIQAREAGKELSICGEIAADPRFVPLLIGLGLHELTVPAAAVARVRAHLFTLRLGACRRLAEACVAAEDVAKVRTRLGRHPEETGQGEGPGTVDPVCGMAVQRDGNPYFLDRGEQRYHFCSWHCMMRFGSKTLDEAHDERN